MRLLRQKHEEQAISIAKNINEQKEFKMLQLNIA